MIRLYNFRLFESIGKKNGDWHGTDSLSDKIPAK